MSRIPVAAVRTNLEKSPFLKRKLGDLPLRPGCYLYRDEGGNLLYVGKAKVLRNRVKSYFQQKRLDAKTRRLVARIWDIELIVCETELEALVLENNLIKEHLPPFNILLKDDKSYPYVKLTWKEAFPKVFVTRKVRKDGSLYFGPFFPASTAYRTAELVYRFFQIRDCDIDIDGKRGRACLKYQLHRCTAPCIAAVGQEAYREQAREARLFLEGKRDELKARLEAAMWKAAEAAAFEQAAQHRDALQQVDAWFTRQKAASADLDDTDVYGSAVLDGRACVHRLMLREGRMVGRQEYLLDDVETFDGAVLAQVLQRVYSADPVPARILAEVQPEDAELLGEWLASMRGTKTRIHVPQKGEKVELLTMAQENARLALERKFEPARLNEAVLEGLQAFLGLSHLPRRLECFDISHGQGREVVASCVVFSDGVPDKARYRRFKMTNEQNDDFANMQEAVTRRYRRMKDEGQEFPNLVLIDGGLGQLHAAEAALRELGLEHLELASLAKKEELVFRPGSSEPLKIPKSSPVLQLLQRIRDEAHRFAITYHRALRAKRTLQTELTQIPGIGQVTAKKLLQTFGSATKVREASPSELADAIGVAASRKVLAWRETPVDGAK
ncbi:MAG: excinuclease ABC subunit UvrC [Geothrix sp.]|uniref:excinuclease ABC subunit UvrC n=1 Tax=Geothrix sp. TaxID=1962974 RepID=UPI0017B1E004|nr:excinuclease ABC subunit UvrC [Geothrix sp.]NWJ40142.1 excinuclease ABC subunit UvrC [Geothrix sp.]WIL21849.1 MAG: excinuclease ABC subunit UvrC [Geothrix sp.]